MSPPKAPRVKQCIYTTAGALLAVAAPLEGGQVAPPQFLTPLPAAAANECMWGRPNSYASCTSCNPSSSHLAHLVQFLLSYQRASQDCNVFEGSICCESSFPTRDNKHNAAGAACWDPLAAPNHCSV